MSSIKEMILMASYHEHMKASEDFSRIGLMKKASIMRKEANLIQEKLSQINK